MANFVVFYLKPIFVEKLLVFCWIIALANQLDFFRAWFMLKLDEISGWNRFLLQLYLNRALWNTPNTEENAFVLTATDACKHKLNYVRMQTIYNQKLK